MDRTVGGLAWTTWLLRLQLPSRCLGLLFVELPSSGARCTLISVLLSDTRGGEPGRTCVHGAVVDGVLPVDCPGCEHGVSDS